MAITMTPMSELDSAFDEVEAAEKDLKKKEELEENAQTEASATSGLAAAAIRDLKNVEARYRVLTAARAGTKELQEKKERLERDLGELEQAQQLHQEAEEAGKLLDAAITEVERAIKEAQGAKDKTEEARSQAEEAEKHADPPAQRDSLHGSAEALQQNKAGLDRSYTGLGDVLKQLKAKSGPIKKVAANAQEVVDKLEPCKKDLEKAVAEVKRQLAAEPPAKDVSEAGKQLQAAQRASDAAPDAERQGRAELKQARQAREEAEEHLRLALAKRDKVERLFIRGIDVSGPDANGTFTAKAEVRQHIPGTYRLRWSSSAGSVNPTTSKPDKTVNFRTAGLPPGSYDIEVRLERVP